MSRVVLTTVMLAIGLVPSSVLAKIEIRNIQAVYGPLGPPRESLNVFPDDEIDFRYEVVGTKTDPSGAYDAELTLRVVGPDGKELLAQTSPLKGIAALGSDSFPGTARVTFGSEPQLGQYLIQVTVKDRLGQESASFERKVTCKPTELAIVALRFSLDAEGRYPAAPNRGLVGQTMHYRFRAIGLDRSRNKLQSRMTLRVLDAQGKDTIPVPLEAKILSDKPEEVKKAVSVTFNGHVTLNRAGTFTLRFEVADLLAKKTVHFEVPLIVTAP